MHIDLQSLINELGPDFALEIARGLRPQSDYLFASILPERERTDYHIDLGDLIIRPTMAGLVGMDSPYPPSGSISVSTFLEKTAKLANSIPFPEKMLREFYTIADRVSLGRADHAQLLATLMNFVEKVIVQPHMDAMEWMRGQALSSGQIAWTYNDHSLSISYGVPAGNLLATRTTASGFAYGAANSTFWADHRTATRLLRNAVEEIVMSSATYDEIAFNDANNIRVLEQVDNVFTITRHVGSTEQLTTDRRDRARIRVYDLEGEILNPATPNTTTTVPFMPDGKISYIGRNRSDDFHVGDGATEDPVNMRELGYTHIAPTVEGGNQPGRWARAYVPQDRPYTFVGEGVTNGLPVLTAPKKLVVLSTELA